MFGRVISRRRVQWLAAAVLTASAVAPSHPSAAPARLLPVDEAASNPEFFAFRARLQRALARHDTAALTAVVDPHIKNSFGGDDGIEAFRTRWRVDAPDSDIWAELSAVLALGGTFQGRDTFVAPYTSSKWPDAFDAFDHVVLIASDVRIRTRPSVEAATASVLSFAILKLAANEDGDWRAVQLDGGRTGYVSAALTRSPIDYRAYFSRTSGQWRLAMFLAGD